MFSPYSLFGGVSVTLFSLLWRRSTRNIPRYEKGRLIGKTEPISSPLGNKRTIIVGDPHGCADELRLLLKNVGYRQGLDSLIIVGDLVAKGPKSAEVIDICIEMDAVSVRGNHDHRVLQFLNKEIPFTSSPSKKKSEHETLAENLTPNQIEYLRKMPLWYKVPEHNVTVVHAGVLPDIPTEENSIETLMWIRSITKDGKNSQEQASKNGGVPWIDKYMGEEIIVYGHDAAAGLMIREKTIGLDSGCCYGNSLSCVVFPLNEVFSVPAFNVYTMIK